MNSRGLTASQIKGVAILTMLLDHIAWLFIPRESVPGFFMHLVGRITAPTMCFFLVEGYCHTRNLRRYAVRLAGFAAVSYLPYVLFSTGRFPASDGVWSFNILYTLLLGLGALYVWERIEQTGLRLVLLAALCLFATLGDWSYYVILFTFSFYFGRGDFAKQAVYFSFAGGIWIMENTLAYFLSVPDSGTVSPAGFLCGPGIQFGVLLCLPLLRCYHGIRGGGRTAGWFFYVFYPLHLTVLYVIHRLVS